MLRGSDQRQERVLTLIGACVVLCIVLALTVVWLNPFSDRPKDVFAVAITTPFVGQGVESGTAVVLHGVMVGRVTGVTSTANGGVQLDTELQSEPLRGLTDAMNVDFRPINYFGVPGINLVPNTGGLPLRDGSAISVIPAGNFTLSELLKQLGDVSESSLTPELIAVIDRATRYTDGLNPLVETAVTVTRAVDAVQTVPTELLLANLSTSIAAFPGFTDAVVEAGTRFIKYDYYPRETRQPAAASGPRFEFPFLQEATTPSMGDIPQDFYRDHYVATMDLVQNGLFAAVGKLVGSHVDDLIPLISGIKTITDAGPVLLRPEDVAAKLAELRTRFQTLYAGNGDQRAISVRLVLDSLPGVAAPIAISTEGTP